MARGNIARRCNECRRQGLSGCAPCNHKDAEYLVMWYEAGKRKRKVIRTKKEAEAFLHQKVSDDILGVRQPEDIIFKDYTEEWFTNYAKSRVKPSTLQSYRYIVDFHLIPAFGVMHLKHITAIKIDGLIAEVSKKRKPKTVNNILILLKTMLKYAKRRGYLRDNPALDVDNVRLEHREMDFLNPTEIGLLLKHSYEPFKTVFLTAALTGMRRGELLALQWGDIDWHSNTIFVRRSLYWKVKKNAKNEGPRYEFVSPKSERSERAIIMSPALKEALEIHRLTCPVSSHDLVFCSRSGSPMDPDNMVKREFLPALVAAELRRVNFHSLRHSYTSMLVFQGENIKFIQSQLGHSSIQTTLDRYGHLLPVNQIGVGSKLDAQIFRFSEDVRGMEEAQTSQNTSKQYQNENTVTVGNR